MKGVHCLRVGLATKKSGIGKKAGPRGGGLCAARRRETVSEDSERRYSASQKSIRRPIEMEEGATVMTRPIVTKGSGNVFRDLGFSEEKSAELIFKSSLLQA